MNYCLSILKTEPVKPCKTPAQVSCCTLTDKIPSRGARVSTPGTHSALIFSAAATTTCCRFWILWLQEANTRRGLLLLSHLALGDQLSRHHLEGGLHISPILCRRLDECNI